MGSSGSSSTSLSRVRAPVTAELDATRQLFAEHGATIAALIVEPVPGNMGCVPPAEGYLEGLRELTQQHGALLIFDEVMSGFRVALGGAQERYGVTPDLVCLGKVIGGGLPVGAYGGRDEIMSRIAPEGPVYQAGTLSGNPLGVAAGLVMVRALRDQNLYPKLEDYGRRLKDGLLAAAEQAGITLCVNQVGSMLTAFFCAGPVTDLASAQQSDLERFGAFHRAMRTHGVLLPPSQFEAAFISAAHTEAELAQTLEAAREAFAELG